MVIHTRLWDGSVCLLSFGTWGDKATKTLLLGWLHKPDCARPQFYPHLYGKLSCSLVHSTFLAHTSPVVCTDDISYVFSRFLIFLYSRSLKCPLHIASYALRIGVSVMEL